MALKDLDISEGAAQIRDLFRRRDAAEQQFNLELNSLIVRWGKQSLLAAVGRDSTELDAAAQVAEVAQVDVKE